MTKKKPNSLKKRFKTLSIRWSLIGLFLSSVFVMPIAFFAVKHSSERQIEITATTLARAFRQTILSYRFRDAKLQIEDVVQLKSNEFIAILDPAYKPFTNDGIESKAPEHCAKPGKPCWLQGISLVSISYPIYFNDDAKSEIFGYLILNLNPVVDPFEILLILLCGIIIFTLHVTGTYSALKKESKHIESVLSEWQKQVDNPKSSRPEDGSFALLDEFLPLDASIQSLHGTVVELEKVAASNAAGKAKIDIVRGIGHDLKTPLSQLSKFFAAFIANTERTLTVNKSEVKKIEDSLSRMGALIRDVTNFDRKIEVDSRTDLNSWMRSYTNELMEGAGKILDTVTFEYRSNLTNEALVNVDEIAIFRILDNLLRNSVESFSENKTGKEVISISLLESDESYEVRIKDNGHGIPENIQNRIFDLDFTTKKIRGTGLGLGIVKKICLDLKLNLKFTSTPGIGTTFNITFPKALNDHSSNQISHGAIVV